MEDKEPFTAKEMIGVAGWAFRWAWKIDGPALVLMTLVTVGGAFLPALLADMTRHMVDLVIPALGRAGSADLAVPLILTVVFMAGAGVYRLLPDFFGQYIQVRFDKGSYRMMIDAMGKLPVRWFDQPEFATHLERYQSSVNITWIALAMVTLPGALAGLVAFLVLAGSVSWPVCVLAALLSLAWVVMAARLGQKEYRNWLDEGESKKHLAYWRQTLTCSWGAKDLRVLRAAPGFRELWHREAMAALERRRAFDIAASRSQDGLRLAGLVGQVLIMALALAELARGHLGVGDVMLFLSLTLSLPGVLGWLGINLVRPVFLLKANRDFKRFYDRDWEADIPGPAIRNDAEDPEVAGSAPGTPQEGGSVPEADARWPAGWHPVPGAPVFSLRNAGYAYQDGTWALRGINLDIGQGEILALVGYNGAGKSTLTRMLLGFYRPMEGEVLFMGRTYTPDTVEAVSHLTGASFQDFHRFELSIRENVAFGHLPSLQDDGVLLKALETGGGDTVLAKAEGNLERHVGRWFTDDGLEVSGGEWQRLTTSRAYVSDRPVFVMDEPASWLDPEAEIRQFRAIRENLGRRTAVLISHRIGFARLADRIAVLDKGRLAELGSHDALMALDGVYAGMFRAQAEWYRHEESVGSGGECPVQVPEAAEPEEPSAVPGGEDAE